MSTPTPYQPPHIWTWDAESGGQWASINRPIAGATHDAELPRGSHPLQIYSLGTPNGQKVTIMAEELLAHLFPACLFGQKQLLMSTPSHISSKSCD